MKLTRFDQLNISGQIVRAVTEKNYEYCTPVQAEAIPPLMEFKDVIAKAPTGTGKTYAFGIPAIEHIDPQDGHVQVLVLAPTRELALQITAEIKELSAYKPGIRMLSIYGGQPIDRQISLLRRHPQIVVATPGRLIDHLNRKTISLDHVVTAVLDEADRMADMGFFKDVQRILNLTTKRKNLALLSATISREVMDLSWVYQRDPVEITIPSDSENRPDILQYSIDVPESGKPETLSLLFEREGCERSIVFCNTKHKAERLTRILKARGLPADCIHGDIRQSIREKVLGAFRSGGLSILVATDVAARGIDVDDVDAVVNYDIPNENEYYIHRIGRTGRAKKHGTSYTFVSNYSDSVRLKEIARSANARIAPMRLSRQPQDCVGKTAAV